LLPASQQKREGREEIFAEDIFCDFDPYSQQTGFFSFYQSQKFIPHVEFI